MLYSYIWKMTDLKRCNEISLIYNNMRKQKRRIMAYFDRPQHKCGFVGPNTLLHNVVNCAKCRHEKLCPHTRQRPKILLLTNGDGD